MNRDLTRAWYTAALSRTKKLPRLQTLLVQDKAKKNQTPAEMKSVLQALGFKAKPMSDEAKRATRLRLN